MMKIGLTLRNLSNRIVSAFSKRQWRRKWGSYVIQKLSDWEFSQIMKSMSSFNIKILISCECWILRRKTVKLERENKSLCWAYQQNIRNCAESFLCLVLCQSSRKHCMMIQLKVAAPPPSKPDALSSITGPTQWVRHKWLLKEHHEMHKLFNQKLQWVKVIVNKRSPWLDKYW